MVDEIQIRTKEIKEFSPVCSQISGDELHVVRRVIREGKEIICNCSRFRLSVRVTQGTTVRRCSLIKSVF